MNDDVRYNSSEQAPRAPTRDEVNGGRRNIAIQHMTIALGVAQAPQPIDEAIGWLDGSIRAHLTAALAMLDGKE